MQHFGAAYKHELARRTVFESELFGMNTYIIMSHLDDYVHLPGRMRTVTESLDPGLIVARRGAVGSKCNFITSVAFISITSPGGSWRSTWGGPGATSAPTII